MKERLGPRPDSQRKAVIAGRHYADIRNAEDPGRKERNERAWALKRKEEEEEKERQKIKKRKEEEEEERERQKMKKRKEEQEKRRQEEKERERESTKIKKAFAAASPEEKKAVATKAYKQLEEGLTEKKRKKYEKLRKRYLEVAQREAAEPGSQELNLSLLQYAMTEVLTGRDPDDDDDEDDDGDDDDEEDEDDVEIMATEELDP